MDGITLSDASFHLVQVAGEADVDFVHFRNMIFQDSYQQLIKISNISADKLIHTSDYGIVENSIFQYTRGVALNYYTGGIDGIGTRSWLVKDNVFRDIASPSRNIAQYAVHFWIDAADNVISNNIFINNDRSIGLGLGGNKVSHRGGEISQNLIIHTDTNDPFADTGIAVESSPDTQIFNNYVYANHGYPRAIEYRFRTTTNVGIYGNSTNKKIASRDSGTALLTDNKMVSDETFYMGKLNEYANKLAINTFY
jgi:hypothetical protein